jgi:hypothetical protein
MQINTPASRQSIPHLAEVAVLRRVAPTHRRRWGTPLGEPPDPPGHARVSPHVSRGQRKEMNGDRRSRLDRMAPVAPYRFGCPGGWQPGPTGQPGRDPLLRAMGGFGPASAGSAQLCQIQPAQYFF